MTVRQGKHMVAFAGVLVALGGALAVFNLVRRHMNHDSMSDVIMVLLLATMLSVFWRYYDRLETAHGPDHVVKTDAKPRVLIIAAGLAVALFVGLVTWLLLAKP